MGVTQNSYIPHALFIPSRKLGKYVYVLGMQSILRHVRNLECNN